MDNTVAKRGGRNPPLLRFSHKKSPVRARDIQPGREFPPELDKPRLPFQQKRRHIGPAPFAGGRAVKSGVQIPPAQKLRPQPSRARHFPLRRAAFFHPPAILPTSSGFSETNPCESVESSFKSAAILKRNRRELMHWVARIERGKFIRGVSRFHEGVHQVQHPRHNPVSHAKAERSRKLLHFRYQPERKAVRALHCLSRPRCAPRCPFRQASLRYRATAGRNGRFVFGAPRCGSPGPKPGSGRGAPARTAVRTAPAIAHKRGGPHPRHTGTRFCCYGSPIRSCYGSMRARSSDCCSRNPRAVPALFPSAPLSQIFRAAKRSRPCSGMQYSN
jgi:hypothetical protein